jgi:ABC-2 type transport system permease protein
LTTFSSLVGALWYLRVNSIIGRIRSRLRRLKQPKYLAGAVVGALYFYFAFFRRTHAPRFGGPAPGAPGVKLPAEVLPLFGEIGALILFLLLALSWFFPRRAALAFSESEIAFLFPAPVSRRMLVNYRLLGAQFGLFFTAIVFTLVSGGGRGFGAHSGYQLLGWWLILALVNLHFMGTSFFYSRLLNRSITTVRRRVLTIGAGAIVVLGLATWIAVSVRLPTSTDFSSAAEAAKYVMEVLHAGPLPWLLALPKLALAPYFAGSPGAFALAMVPALILLAIHYLWVVHTETAFEEASIARAEKRGARRRASQQGDWRGHVALVKARTPAFALGSIGRLEFAFLWKNLLATSGFFRPRPILVLTALLVGVTSWLSRQPELAGIRLVLSIVGAVILVMTVLLGPQVARQDLRTDLANADILKTYPLRGWQIVLGEILTPVAMLTVVFWIALMTVYLSLPGDVLDRIPLGLRSVVALALAVLAPAFIALQVLMPNAAAVLFPAWVQATRDQTERGFEVLGQRLIFVAGQLLVTALALLPALLVGVLVFFMVKVLAGFAIAAAMAVIVMAVLLAYEAWLGIRWLGDRFEDLDISSELRP